MSKRHDANRRRAYGRRQHEMHQRTERPDRFLGWVEVNLSDRTSDRIAPDRQIRSTVGDWILSTGMD
jgi:hypothetical protein